MKRLSSKSRSGIEKGKIISGVLLLALFLIPSYTTRVMAQENKTSNNRPLAVSSAKSLPARPSASNASARRLRGNIAPDFILDSMTGGKYQLSSTRGKVVLLDFWHTY